LALSYTAETPKCILKHTENIVIAPQVIIDAEFHVASTYANVFCIPTYSQHSVYTNSACVDPPS